MDITGRNRSRNLARGVGIVLFALASAFMDVSKGDREDEAPKQFSDVAAIKANPAPDGPQ